MANKYRAWADGETLTAANLIDYVQKQVLINCDSSADYPDSSTRREGMAVYDKNADALKVYTTTTTGWQAPWNMAWGVVPATSGGTSGYGHCRVTSTQGTFTGATDVTNASVTFTAVANRLYKVTAHVDITSSVTGDGAQVQVLVDGTAYATDIVAVNIAGTGGDRFIKIITSFTIAAGSHTVKLQAQRVTGTGNLTIQGATGSPTILIVEDIGPAGAPA